MKTLAFITALTCSAPAFAADVIGDLSPQELKDKLTAWGYEVFAHEDEQDRPQLLVTPKGEEGREQGRGFAMRMMGCVPVDAPFYDRRCDGYEFRAYLTPGFPIKDKVYADWNRDVGHTRAFVKEDHPRLAWRVTIKGGVTWDNVQTGVEIWRQELADYLDHLDASVLD